MFVTSLIGLAVAAAVIALAICSGHIPWLARLLGAEPLLPEEPPPPDHARDFAASVAHGYVTPADWGPDWPRPALPTQTEEEDNS